MKPPNKPLFWGIYYVHPFTPATRPRITMTATMIIATQRGTTDSSGSSVSSLPHIPFPPYTYCISRYKKTLSKRQSTCFTEKCNCITSSAFFPTQPKVVMQGRSMSMFQRRDRVQAQVQSVVCLEGRQNIVQEERSTW